MNRLVSRGPMWWIVLSSLAGVYGLAALLPGVAGFPVGYVAAVAIFVNIGIGGDVRNRRAAIDIARGSAQFAEQCHTHGEHRDPRCCCYSCDQSDPLA